MPGLGGHRARPNPSLPCHRAKQAATARVGERLSGTCGRLASLNSEGSHFEDHNVQTWGGARR